MEKPKIKEFATWEEVYNLVSNTVGEKFKVKGFLANIVVESVLRGFEGVTLMWSDVPFDDEQLDEEREHSRNLHE